MFWFWMILIFGGFCEAGWAYCLNRSRIDGRWWLAGFAALYILSAVCLAVASKRIPVGTAYAVWTGIGATTTILLGILVFNEPLTVVRLICITLIFAAVVGLYLTMISGSKAQTSFSFLKNFFICLK